MEFGLFQNHPILQEVPFGSTPFFHFQMQNSGIRFDESLFQRHGQDEGISQLAASIKELGLVYEIVVVQKEGYFRIVDGNRRYLAHKQLKRPSIRARIEQDSTMVSAVAANTHQIPLDTESKFKAVAEMLHQNPQSDSRNIGTALNLPSSQVCKYMRLARAIPQIGLALERNSESIEGITMGVALALAYQKSSARQKSLLEVVLRSQKDMNRRMTREEFLELAKGKNEVGLGKEKTKLQALENKLCLVTGLEIFVRQRIGRSKCNQLVFQVHPDTDLEPIIEFLERVCVADSSVDLADIEAVKESTDHVNPED